MTIVLNSALRKGLSVPLALFSLYTHAQVSGPGQAPARAEFREAAVSLNNAIQQHFLNPATGYYNEHAEKDRNKNPVSYLWPLCGLIQAGNELDVLQGTAVELDRYMFLIDRYEDQRPPVTGYASYPPEKGGGDRFYDDNQWIGIAVMDAWKRRPDTAYRRRAELIYTFMMTAYDSVGGGGLYWEEGKLNTKNTCSNGPGILLALQLHQASGKKTYLDTALLLYNWVNNTLRDDKGLYFDNIGLPSRKIDQRRYAYNTGTMLQANVMLYEITRNPKYLAEAKRIATAATTYFLPNGKMHDGYWFSAVLLRAYQQLLQYDNDTNHIKAFAKATRNAIASERNKDGLYISKGKTVDLVNQSGMLEILARLAYLEKNYQF
ncbi:glycoside hydrolase family 76 protein [Flavihumibacter petaseus]|uniref:Putative glycosidase n=1 Tax=Flavihumibacter petaseus NBRC 106054 TaxID=1220578 RepID=A0A0E9N4P7_9BACT|nr:glycoside hydrolase family 76 protein [Flavihumibacter petaseus]GAO44646.1 putative glycosidase [Flavihumibacter petaseus NBRC 106054]